MVHWQEKNGQRLIASAATVGLHVLAITLLLQYPPVRSTLIQVAPIMVSLITSAKIAEKPAELPKPLPVKPKAQKIKVEQPQPQVTAATEAPSPETATAPAPQPPATVEHSAPLPSAVTAATSVPLVPPNYNADYLVNPPPHYPALSRRMGEQGKVMLRVLVNRKGTADKVELRSSSGSSRLDGAALETVKRWRFIPARQGDQPVAAWVLIPITFTLKG